DGAGGAFLDAADIAGVMVIDLLLQLLAGQQDLGGIDDNDIVAAIHMRGVGRLVLAAQTHGDDGGQAAHNQAGGIDHDPLLFNLAMMMGAAIAGGMLGGLLSIITKNRSMIAYGHLAGAGLAITTLIIPYLAVAVRRLHDLNMRGWWLLLALFPGAGGLFLL